MTSMTETNPADIGKLAQEIQKQADTAKHLAQTVSQALCDLDNCEHCQPQTSDSADRILLFTDLIEAIAKKIGAIALRVEEADSRSRFPTAA